MTAPDGRGEGSAQRLPGWMEEQGRKLSHAMSRPRTTPEFRQGTEELVLGYERALATLGEEVPGESGETAALRAELARALAAAIELRDSVG